jgi:lysozyme family protein
MVARNFPAALRETLRHEGGYVDHPRDPGGATNLGITLRTAQEAGLDIDRDGDVDKIDVSLLTLREVGPIYKAKYWNAVEGDRLPSGVDLMVFDAGVNSGPTRARRWLQEALKVHPDGIIGKQTLAALEKARPVEVIERLRLIRYAHYRSLDTFDVFGKGWMRRLAGVYARSIQLAGVK